MSLVAAFTLIALCGVIILCAVIVRQTGDPVNRYGIYAGAAVFLIQAAVVTQYRPASNGGFYSHPAELTLAITLIAVLAALTLRILRYRRLGQLIDPVADANMQLPGLLNSLPVQAAFITPDLRYGFVNDAYCEAADKPRSDILGRHLSEVIRADLLPDILSNVKKALSGEQVTWLFDFSQPLLQRTEGSAVYQPLSDRGQVVGVLVMVMDRSAPQDAAQKAEISETKHALAAEVAGVGYLEWDGDGNLVDVSPEVETLLGRDAETLRKMWAEGQRFVDPRSRATIRHSLNTAGRHPRDVIETLRFVAANGRQI